MQYILNELKALFQALVAMVSFYGRPAWVLNGIQQHPNAIEQAMLHVKKSIALMVIIITVMSLLFSGFEFVQEQEKPGEIFAVLLVHGAMVTVLLAAVAWLGLRDHHQVGLLVGWFIVVYWVPLWLWNMLFEIHAGFSSEKYHNLFLQLAHDEAMQDWHLWVLGLIWVHATAIAVYGLHRLLAVQAHYLWALGCLASVLYLGSFLLLHHTQKGVEIIYLIFGMG
ncbi:hypothetical protein [Marinicella meishanensis]|uniref:hypothetical protein n=1 Tax=Marinicella meishanensis TaxID=2873263 RepID=UPI001CC1397D|nr:hypothetical protein [Marinicella sp. NBU2979]